MTASYDVCAGWLRDLGSKIPVKAEQPPSGPRRPVILMQVFFNTAINVAAVFPRLAQGIICLPTPMPPPYATDASLYIIPQFRDFVQQLLQVRITLLVGQARDERRGLLGRLAT